MIIAVDFDGTIVEHKYPEIGKEKPFAIQTLKRLQSERHMLILWTVREGKLLDEAVDFCRKRGLEFYAVNANNPDEQKKDSQSTPCRKLRADMYIDDCNIGKLPDWGAIYHRQTARLGCHIRNGTPPLELRTISERDAPHGNTREEFFLETNTREMTPHVYNR